MRAAAFDLVRDLAAPLVERGVAGLEWTEPDDRDSYAGVELVPSNEAAAKVAVFPEATVVTLLVGPRGSAHELGIDRDGGWRRELRACLEAVVDGRYRESASPGTLSRVVLTLTFEMPDGRDVVVKHLDLTEPVPSADEPPPERRFAPYA